MKRLKLLCVQCYQLFGRPTEALLYYGNGVQAVEQASCAIPWRCDLNSLIVASSMLLEMAFATLFKIKFAAMCVTFSFL